MRAPSKSKDFRIPHYTIEPDILPAQIFVIVSPDAVELRKHPDAVALFGEFPGEFAGCCSYSGSYFSLWFPTFTSDVIAHEVYHCVDRIMNRFGIPLSPDTGEVRAYFYEWLFGEVNSCLNDSVRRGLI
jgi:hypothetical protein